MPVKINGIEQQKHIQAVDFSSLTNESRTTAH